MKIIDCPRCGANRIRDTVAMCETCEVAQRYEDAAAKPKTPLAGEQPERAIENALKRLVSNASATLALTGPDRPIVESLVEGIEEERTIIDAALVMLAEERRVSNAALDAAASTRVDASPAPRDDAGAVLAELFAAVTDPDAFEVEGLVDPPLRLAVNPRIEAALRAAKRVVRPSASTRVDAIPAVGLHALDAAVEKIESVERDAQQLWAAYCDEGRCDRRAWSDLDSHKQAAWLRVARAARGLP